MNAKLVEVFLDTQEKVKILNTKTNTKTITTICTVF